MAADGRVLPMEGREVKAQKKAEAQDDELPGIIRTWGKRQKGRPEALRVDENGITSFSTAGRRYTGLISWTSLICR